MKFKTLLFVFLCCAARLYAGTEKDTVIVRKMMAAQRISAPPKIDGVLNDECWKNAEIATNFRQNSPTEKAPVSFETEVKILYDNTAIYIGAMCYDSSPDSILRQLGLRDEYPNADNFRVVFDTYNTQQDAFNFTVTASNVQNDSRVSDYNFNAVWKSNVQILSNGWSVEIEIPWSALRFPSRVQQNWGLQLTRSIQRKFEFDQWALTPKGSPNPMKYWGILTGLDSIESPVRLSLTPYISSIVEKDSRFGTATPSASIGGGLGLKYGINESFTLDMTLLPDFSQVRSDNIIKNLSPFEIQFQEQRPFFTEGVDLFSRGDIFYSRRIGKTPSEFYSAPDLATSSEKIIKNPTQSRLLNATKVTGRTNNGLGIGILNAYVGNTYATATDTITGESRKILTEPATNYNIFVFDKQLANSSNVYVTNTNVIRTGGYRSANVTATGFSLNNKKNTWNFSGDGGVSNVLEPTFIKGQFESSIGYYYRLSVNKNSGKLQY
ncbi:MAG: carbohydrate binding family 9 domain-containing protein, partial [Bacteroidota bacterium]|nr:carbohydrate binding family 9 domain-containing protein [Bacteroidota bacterium]